MSWLRKVYELLLDMGERLILQVKEAKESSSKDRTKVMLKIVIVIVTVSYSISKHAIGAIIADVILHTLGGSTPPV